MKKSIPVSPYIGIALVHFVPFLHPNSDTLTPWYIPFGSPSSILRRILLKNCPSLLHFDGELQIAQCSLDH